MNAAGAWARRRQDYDSIGKTARKLSEGCFLPTFVQEAHVIEKVDYAEHVAALKVALARGRLSTEKALIKAAENNHMQQFLRYAIDLNIIRNLQWKVEQDSKGR
jgi:hypothetical protein